MLNDFPPPHSGTCVDTELELMRIIKLFGRFCGIFAGHNNRTVRLCPRPTRVVQENILQFLRCHLQISAARDANRAQLFSHYDGEEIAPNAKHHDKYAAGKPSISFNLLFFFLQEAQNTNLQWNAPAFQAQSDSAQENKVTITLIAVVILFLVCQSPSAIQLLVTIKYDKSDHQPPNLTLGKLQIPS